MLLRRTESLQKCVRCPAMGCVTARGKRGGGPGGGEFPEIVLHIHLHILSGLDMCIGLPYEAFNMYILFINLENYRSG